MSFPECGSVPCSTCLTAMPNQPSVTEHRADGLFVAVVRIPGLGTLGPQHAHFTSHLTLVMQGVVRVFRDGMPPRDFSEGDAILIPAAEKHLFQTLSDGATLACIHASTTGQVAILAEHQLAGAS